MKLTIKQLADSAGVTVRTLHYYDQKGLLKPASRSRSGYRYYDMDSVLNLQQILFFRELGFSLEDIKTILERPDFNLMDALLQHRELLKKQQKHIDDLLLTLDRTIESKRKEMNMDIKEYYTGFSDDQVEKYREEVKRRWGEETLKDSEERLLNMGKNRFIEVQAEGGRIFKTIYDNMSLGYKNKFIQQQIELWRQWLEHFHHYSDEEVLGLGKAYSESADFAMFFNQYDADLPLFLTKAITYYVSKNKRRKMPGQK